MRYRTLLFDLDHTLLDSDTSETAAFAHTVRGAGLEPTEDLFDRYRAINRTLWAAVERGETTPVEVGLNRFEQFIDACGIDADAEAMADAFTTGLGAYGELYPGARDVLERLAEGSRLGMITNGLSEVQRARIERLDLASYFDAVVISAEVGTSKPGSAIFDLAFAELGHPDRAETLMIGDSLTSDIRGGGDYGLDTCWYNPDGHRSGSAPPVSGPTFEISRLEQLPPLVSG